MRNILSFEGAFNLFTYLFVLWFSLSFHEYAHGWVAKLRGDKTAEVMGRLTLNPFAHIDIVGTVVLPILSFINPGPFSLFGWAKPVPVDSRYLKNPRKDLFWIAFAGPLSNIILAVACTVVMMVFLIKYRPIVIGCMQSSRLGCDPAPYEVFKVMQTFIMLNISLALLNLIPVHPLDGGKVLARFLSPSAAMKFEELEPQLSWALLIFAVLGGLSFLLSGPVMYLSGELIELADRFSRILAS